MNNTLPPDTPQTINYVCMADVIATMRTRKTRTKKPDSDLTIRINRHNDTVELYGGSSGYDVRCPYWIDLSCLNAPINVFDWIEHLENKVWCQGHMDRIEKMLWRILNTTTKPNLNA